MIRIGIYGNNLNQGYFIAGFLRELGVHAKVFLPAHSHEQDTPSWWTNNAMDEDLVVRIPKPVYVGASGDLIEQPTVRSLYEVAESFDILLLREEGPAVFSELKGIPRVFAAQGADIQLWPWWLHVYFSPRAIANQVSASWRFPLERRIDKRLTDLLVTGMRRARSFPELSRAQKRQRLGIRQCERAIVAPYQKHLLNDLEYPPSHISFIPLPSTPPSEMDKQVFSSSVSGLLNSEDVDLLFLHPTRFYFNQRDGNRFLKDNHKLLFAYSSFLSNFGGRCKLVLVEKGLPEDLADAKSIVSDLDLADRVVWIPELSNLELRALFLHPKAVICDQYSPFLNSLGNIGRESVYFGKPIITSYDGEDDIMYTERPPNIYSANSVDSIVEAMKRVALLTRVDREALIKSCREWYSVNLDPLENTQRYLSVCTNAWECYHGGGVE